MNLKEDYQKKETKPSFLERYRRREHLSLPNSGKDDARQTAPCSEKKGKEKENSLTKEKPLLIEKQNYPSSQICPVTPEDDETDNIPCDSGFGGFTKLSSSDFSPDELDQAKTGEDEISELICGIIGKPFENLFECPLNEKPGLGNISKIENLTPLPPICNVSSPIPSDQGVDRGQGFLPPETNNHCEKLFGDNDSQQRPLLPIQKDGTEFNLLLKIWNECNLVPKHDPKKYTKNLQESQNSLFQLAHGTFFTLRKFDPDWMIKNKIPEDWKTKKFTFQELQTGIRNFLLFHKIGYWPSNKKNLPKSLSSALYKSFGVTPCSWVLKALACPPESLGGTKREIVDRIPIATESILRLLGEDRETISGKDLRTINDGISWMLETYENALKWRCGRFVSDYPHPAIFCTSYIKWVTEQDWITEINIKTFRRGNGAFKIFVKKDEEYYQEVVSKFRISVS